MAEDKYNRQQKYRSKNGIVSKSYSLKKGVVDRFAEACRMNGESQSAKLSELMELYIKSVSKEQ